MIKKTFTILCIYFFIVFINACYCPEPQLPYFDFEAINITTDKPNPNHHENGFSFTITFDSIAFLAQNNIQFINNAYALSCEESGDYGLKYGIKEINVYADSIFDASIPSAERLNEFFEVSMHTSAFTPLNEFNDSHDRIYYRSEIRLFSQSVPVDLNRDYNFVIEIIKENNDIVKSEAGPLRWSE